MTDVSTTETIEPVTESNSAAVIMEEWINRAQACELLGGISERAVQRYASKGDIKVDHRRRASGGSEAYYSKLDVLALKHRLASPQPKPSNALIKAQTQALTVPSPTETARNKRTRPDVRTAERLIVTVAEVVALTQLSEERIREHLKSGLLKGFLQGRRWRIKRKDLDAYVDAL
jgi:excisionase family DNA binding protein